MVLFLIYCDMVIFKIGYFESLPYICNPKQAAVVSTNHKKMSDNDLVSLYLETQSSLYFGELYDRYGNKVYAKCLSMLRDNGLAEDAAQDIFTKIFTRLDSFNKDSRFSTWIYAITYNYCIDFIRKNKRSIVNYGDDSVGVSLPDTDPTDRELMEIELDRLKIGMDRIPLDDREVLLMKYKEDMSIKEICEVLDKSESAVKMKILRAKQRVREACEDMAVPVLIIFMWYIVWQIL